MLFFTGKQLKWVFNPLSFLFLVRTQKYTNVSTGSIGMLRGFGVSRIGYGN